MSAPLNLIVFLPETIRADAAIGPAEGRAQTPHLDALAADGVSFTDAFCQMSYCTPSRIGMFTGLYPHNGGHRSLLHLLRRHERHFFRDLKEAGYINVAYGKNDFVAHAATDLAFDETQLRIKPTDGAYMANPWPEGHKHRTSFYHGKRTKSPCFDYDSACIQSALDFLDEPHDRPFCIYLPLLFAHPPYEAEEPWFSLHDRARVRAPIPPSPDIGRCYRSVLYHGMGLDRLDEKDFREIRAVYYGMISRVDAQLGQLVAKLKERGLYDSTAIVASSDHGDFAGDYGLIEKYFAGFEDALLRVPLVFRVPGLARGVERRGLVELTDLYPTLMDIVGLPSKHDHFGRSLLPALRGGEWRGRDAVFAEAGVLPGETQFSPPIPDNSPYTPMRRCYDAKPASRSKAAMIRTETRKYIYCPGDCDELFALDRDPQERTNLADHPDFRAEKEGLRERLLRWLFLTADTLPRDTDRRNW
ncbi:MAG: sulfatase-like hydrolase/transferase [Lentisphaerae bacterium]|nr:sulfatase-like hydrolase/transferase [Lentisphaerota bacterium]